MARTMTKRNAGASSSTRATKAAKLATAANGDNDSDGSLTELSSGGEEEADGQDSSEDESVEEDDDDNDEDFGARPKTKTSGRKSAAATPKKSKITPRARKSLGTTSKTAKASRTTGPSRARAPTGKSRAASSRDELPINEDNDIFNSVKDPNAALQSTAEDWVVAFSSDQGPALAELINFFIRVCGCNGSIDENQVVDIDHVVDNLEDLQEEFKKQPIPSYPIVSKSKTFKSFRKSLSEFLQRLVMSAYEAEILTTDGFMETYSAWVSAMSSSSLRSFRHTATVLALWTISAINEVNGQASKDLSIATKQRDAEKKKARTDKSRLKDLESKVVSARKLKAKLEEYINEFINSVFIHRFRDFDAGIRSECVEGLGSWMKKYPAQYLQSSYFRYVGWVLSDVDANVRMSAVQAMTGLYSKDNFVSSTRHFTEMFKGRLVQMATGDVELGVRIATIHVLVMIDKHDLLEDEQRDLLATHIFDIEPRIRSAVAGFVANVLQDAVIASAGELGSASAASKKKGKQDEERQQEAAKLRFKCLAELLVKYGNRLDSGDLADPAESEELTTVIDGAKEGRIGLAIEALWDAVGEMQQWKPLVELLLLDHSDRSGSGRKNPSASENAAAAVYRLEPEHEAVLVETLVAILRKVYVQAESNDDPDDTSKEDITRAMIAALPKLFAKYRTDGPRIADLLLLPQIMDLEMYTEMQETAAYEALWDDVSNLVQRHVEPLLLRHAVQTVQKLMRTSAQSTVNATKLSALEDALVSSLRDTVSNRDVETAGFSEDEVHLLAATVLRLHLVSQVSNTSDALEEDEGGQVTSGWEIILGLVSRGRLAYQEEEKLIEDAISVLSLYVMWKTRQAISPEGQTQTSTAEALLAKRNALLALLEEFVASTVSQANAGVQRVAFEKLLSIHMLYAAIPQAAAEGSDAASMTLERAPDDSTNADPARSGPRLPAILVLQCEQTMQQHCASFIQTEIERYIEKSGTLEKEARSVASAHDEQSDEEEDNAEDIDVDSGGDGEDGGRTPKASRIRGGTKSKPKAGDGGSKLAEVETRANERHAQAELQSEHTFCATISTLVSAIRIGIIDAKYASMILTHFGRLGTIYDSCCKALIDILKEEAIFGGYNRAVIVESCIWDALRESFELYLDNKDSASEARFVSLSRQLANALVVRGAGFTAIRKIDARCLISLHNRASEHIAQKVAAAERNGNKKVKQTMPALYKGMANLLMTATPTDAVKIKSAMDRAYRAANVQIPPASKAWDAQRSYEKRLLKIAAKSTLFAPPGTAKKASAAARKPSTTAHSGGLDSGGELSDDDQDDGLPANGSRILPPHLGGASKRSRPEDDVSDDAADRSERGSDGPADLEAEMEAVDEGSPTPSGADPAGTPGNKRRKVTDVA
nr:sister chromatid cohesion subunit [Tranzscheliella williamsii]